LKRINKQTVINAAIWTMIIVGLGGLLFLSVQRKKNADVSGLVVDLQTNENGKLISEKEVINMVKKSIGFNPTKKSIRRINTRKLEFVLSKDPRIKNAEVYFDSKNRLHIQVVPKEVILRISDVTGKQYFLDETGNQVPVYKGSAVRVPLANGYINRYTEGFASKPDKTPLKEVFDIIRYVRNDEFLHALIEQIHVDETGEILLIPKVGKEKLIFGGAENMDEKFDNLKIFYKDGMTKIGWNKFPSINLKFMNQVVLVDNAPVQPVAAAESKPVQQH
jgi:cell division protein FtsQ